MYLDMITTGWDVRVLQMVSDRCAAQFFNCDIMFYQVTMFKSVTARMKWLLATGGDLSEFRIEGPTLAEEAMQQAAACAGKTYTRALTKAALAPGYYLTLGKQSEVSKSNHTSTQLSPQLCYVGGQVPA